MQFLDEFGIGIYSDHLSLSRDRQGYLYDLMPIPRTPASAMYVADKVKAVQDLISRRLVLENISYYVQDSTHMPDADFVALVIELADCGLLLDVNNVYVNSMNHGTNPYAFIDTIPSKAVTYMHIAGHLDEPGAPRILDTHGSAVTTPVIELGAYAFRRFGELPVVLERDNNLPSLTDLCKELSHICVAMTKTRSEPT